MDTDRELLEWAAKAARIEYTISKHGTFLIAPFENPLAKRCWNPLENDDDALRLAVRCGISIGLDTLSQRVIPWVADAIETIFEPFGNDPLAATRRAIVRAAAEIGKAMK